MSTRILWLRAIELIFRTSVINTVFLAILLPTIAYAGENQGESSERDWSVGVAIRMGLLGQSADSGTQSNVRPTENPGARLSNSTSLLLPGLGASLEVMTETLSHVPGRPRVFVHADIQAIMAAEQKLAFEGAAGAFQFPESPFVPEEGIGGQGSRTSLDVATLTYGAGVGLAFDIKFLGYQLKIKPSVEYFRYSGAFRGIVTRAFKPNFDLPVERLVRLQFAERRTWDAIGGGLELETKVFEFKNVSGVAFVTGRGYSIVGDRSISRRLTNPATPVDDEALFTYKAAPAIFSFGVGFRLRWTGF